MGGGIHTGGGGAIPNRIELDCVAPEFELDDWKGRTVRLSDFAGKQHVVLVFNRGFT